MVGMAWREELRYSIDVFHARDNLLEVRARLDTLDAARAAYDVYLKMPREPGQVVMIRQKAPCSGAATGRTETRASAAWPTNMTPRAPLAFGISSAVAPPCARRAI